MDKALKDKALAILAENRAMTVATLRPDGWPQATTVGFAYDGLTLYFLCGKDSQKAANLARDNRISVTVGRDAEQVMEITGLSMAARATTVTDETEGERVLALLFSRYPAQKGFTLQLPKPQDVALFRVTPTVISVLDYSKGFAHTDLVACSERELV